METYKDHITITPDGNSERMETLRKLFPDWFTQEGRLDINEVKKIVDPEGNDETERYEFRQAECFYADSCHASLRC